MKEQLKKYIDLLSKPIVLVLINVFVGALYYFFRLGFYHFFGIPRYFIDFNIMDYGFVFVSLSVIFPILVYAYQRLLSNHISTFRLLLLSVLFLVFSYSLYSESHFFIFLITLFVFFIKALLAFTIFLLAVKLLFKITKINFFNKILIHINKFKFNQIKVWFSRFDKKITKLTFINSFVMIIVFVCFFVLVSILGESRARDLTYDYLQVNNKNYIVVDQYSDKLLLLPINLKSKVVKKHLYLYKIEDLSINKTSLILKTTSVSKVED